MSETVHSVSRVGLRFPSFSAPKKMGYKPTPKTPVDPSALTAPEFRKFLEYFPDAVLKEYKIPGYAALRS